jgi:hypothetical protein
MSFCSGIFIHLELSCKIACKLLLTSLFMAQNAPRWARPDQLFLAPIIADGSCPPIIILPGLMRKVPVRQ